MRSGTLDTRVRLQRQGAPVDDGVTIVPGAFADIKPDPVWASVRTAPGTERLANAENAAHQVNVFRIRWDPDLADLNPRDRLVQCPDLEEFDIKGVQMIGRREMIEIAAVARVND